MKTCRWLVIPVILLFFTSFTFAQKIGVKIGASLQISYVSEGENFNDDLKIRAGFHAGLLFEMPL
ncbi:MAG: hypothetical protein IPO04_05845 [Cytophagaceae bacterium]|nr:hypothetical protein [Cytophagaceae bacterium]